MFFLFKKSVSGLVVALVCTRPAQSQVLVSVTGKYYPPVQTFEPSSTHLLSFTKATVSAQVVQRSGGLYLDIARKGKTTQTLLPSEIGEVKWIASSFRDGLVVSGLVNSSGSEVLTISPDGRITDKFVCYSPAMSPDGRSVAFIRYYPPHFSEHSQNDVLMLYDLTRSPSDNRANGTPATDWLDVGRVLYSPETKLMHADMGEAGTSASGLFWSPSSENIVWLVHDVSYELLRITVDSQNVARLSKAQIPTSLVCASIKSSNVNTTCNLLMRDVTFGPQNYPVKVEIEIVPDRQAILRLAKTDFR